MQPDCPKCGQQHLTIHGNPSCGSHKKTGVPCRKPAMEEQRVCASHGGKAPQAKHAASLRIAEREARRVMEAYGRPIETTATEALLNEVRRTAGHVEYLAQKVSELEEHELIWGTTRIKEGGQDGGTTQEAEAHMWLKLYHSERDRLVRVCDVAIRCGIEERYVRLAESQGQLVAEAIKAILGDLKLTPEQTKLAANVVPLRLRQLTA